jgi:thiol-disulfide isomerase/thioredoxin
MITVIPWIRYIMFIIFIIRNFTDRTGRKQMSIISKITVVLIFGIVGCNGTDKDNRVSITETDRQISKIRLKDLDEQIIDLQKYKGKTIFINFWATWCRPCLEEMPSIEKAQNILRNEEVVFLLASGESAEEIDAFRNAHDYKFNYVRIENSEELGIQVLPTTYIFNPEGKLVFSESGYRNWNEKNNIDMILKIANKNE